MRSTLKWFAATTAVAVLAVVLTAPLPAADETVAPAKELTVDEIVRKANIAAYYPGDDGKAQVKMTIYDSAKDKEKGKARTREFIILRKNVTAGGNQFFYVFFSEPPDIRKMVYRVWKHVGDTGDDRWLYLPALDLIKRIAPGDKRTSFVGSHFVYEDVSGRDINEDTHELLEITETQYVLKHTPKKPGDAEFTWYKMWVDRKTFLPVKTEYYNKQGKVYRIIEALEIKTIDDKYPTVMKARVRDLDTGGETINEFVKVKYNAGLKESLFKQERYLRRAPREARKW
jgi:Outer membrane lipoprotein-sorting protein